jgi:hypothetical protein
MDALRQLYDGLSRVLVVGFGSRVGDFRSWPSRAVLIDEPLALAEAQTSRLRRIYEKCAANLWDGPAVFREAVAKHGGIQLDPDKRRALAHPISMLMWGELAAWIVSAELAERLEDPDARMAASSQVFDEARHFYIIRDYLALLHVPVPGLDPFFAAGLRSLLDSKDLTLKLLTMQILVEGAAQSVFQFLADSNVEPVLSEILPYIERDEARHVGLGILHLPQLLAALSPRQKRQLSLRVTGIGDMLGLGSVRMVDQWRALGLDPRELITKIDHLLMHLHRKLGPEPYFRTDDPRAPDYVKKLDLLVPLPNATDTRGNRVLHGLLGVGARLLAV